MQNLTILITGIILVAQIHDLFGLPLIDISRNVGRIKRSDDKLLPNENFSLVTDEKLVRLQQLADSAHDPKLYDLYRVVNHYVEMARRNREHVLWKYDTNQEGLVLVLKQNLNGILYYG
ncbi:unnamed protein product [Rotaria socialis]|uniref:Uncharacterized protein n=1 Tax=Rotaria socialis TaxID=392032 RepID=A0A817ZLS4_9BILA|nr:unnamed protein product [Rotaria socialis]CAF3435620.1 unnamed protein product [Rotaria socialis]CAF3774935.1 unnamed protein product [Rotaria socialis]CAF4569017.1 unnamed protein product [Rotaria socialis]CAF4596447.1 unnamed protein product [Rotaria socialis]